MIVRIYRFKATPVRTGRFCGLGLHNCLLTAGSRGGAREDLAESRESGPGESPSWAGRATRILVY